MRGGAWRRTPLRRLLDGFPPPPTVPGAVFNFDVNHRVHHLSCGSFCPVGGRLTIGGTGELVCHCLLVETDEGLLLVDTGFGTNEVRDRRKTLGAAFVALAGPRLSTETTALAQVKALGFSPDDVRHIAVTHLDLDHAGGLADFPRARVHVHGAEQRAALAPSWREVMRYKPHQWAHGPEWRLYDQTSGERWFGLECVRQLDGLPPEVLLVPLGGHSRGHSAIAVDTGHGWLLHAGDAYFAHGEVHEGGPPVAASLDVYETILAADNSLRVANQKRLRQLAREHHAEVTVFCAHDPAEMP